ncbi:hypothetical protein UFOVP605_31 [uncultured Caudovirales phage]|uniref:Uncharacterized protein n=1 Tax=uncultured Caudovirales phage TaxID=2100421 RepID=A0A6J5N028_9CAUD|nr:hypothetical protein UFOVP605_31 [uncultured Caudovirales phage]
MNVLMRLLVVWIEGVVIGVAFYLCLLVLMNWLQKTFNLKDKTERS